MQEQDAFGPDGRLLSFPCKRPPPSFLRAKVAAARNRSRVCVRSVVTDVLKHRDATLIIRGWLPEGVAASILPGGGGGRLSQTENKFGRVCGLVFSFVYFLHSQKKTTQFPLPVAYFYGQRAGMEGSFSDGTIAPVARVGDKVCFAEDLEQQCDNGDHGAVDGAGNGVGANNNDCNCCCIDMCEHAQESSMETAPKKKKPSAAKRGKGGTDTAQQDNATSPGASDCVNTSDGAAGKKKASAPKSRGILKQPKTRPPARPHKRLSQDVLVSRIADMDGKKQVLESKLVLIKARLELHKNEMQFRQSEGAQNDN